jgi:transposase
MTRRAADGRLLASVECTGSYGANLARTPDRAGVEVVEAKPPARKNRTGRGKSDPIDAEAAARTVLGAEAGSLPTPRTTRPHHAELQLLLAERDYLSTRRTAAINTLTAMLRANNLGVDARKALTPAQIGQLSKRRPGHDAALGVAVRRAKDILALAGELADNEARLRRLADTAAPGLTDLKGVGPITAARLLAPWGGPGRIRPEAAFARLAGVAPIPASSGNTVRHHLSRRGDQKLNAAIHTIARSRRTCDPETQAYIAKRTAKGKTDREALRCLKHHITRQLHRQLKQLTT